MTMTKAVPVARKISTRTLFTAGALAGPMFAVTAAGQVLGRTGFDLTRHPISLLATGDLGWIQILNFILAGCGVLALGIGLARTGVRWRAYMVGGFGVGLIAAGVFTADPENGFPVGTAEGAAAEMSWHATVHVAAAVLAFLALAGATIIATVQAARERRLAAAVGHGVVSLVLLLPNSPEHASIQLAATGAIAFAWTTIVAARRRRAA